MVPADKDTRDMTNLLRNLGLRLKVKTPTKERRLMIMVEAKV